MFYGFFPVGKIPRDTCGAAHCPHKIDVAFHALNLFLEVSDLKIEHVALQIVARAVIVLFLLVLSVHGACPVGVLPLYQHYLGTVNTFKGQPVFALPTLP